MKKRVTSGGGGGRQKALLALIDPEYATQTLL